MPILVLLAMLLAVAQPSFAQSSTGTITGIVVDMEGAAVAQARITVTNIATGAEREVKTDAGGRFAAPALQVGPYEVTATKQGFATRRQEDLRLQVGQTISIRIELGLAAAADTITIGPTPSAIEMARSQFSTIVPEVAVANLPLRQGDALELPLITAGVTRDVRTGEMSAAGLPSSLNGVVVDGVDANNSFFGRGVARLDAGSAPFQFGRESLRELQVATIGYSAEYGRAAGAVISTVTQSGTNRVAGSAFEFYGDTALTSNTIINLQHDLPKASSHSNQFGATVGGPVARNRAFYFASYEGLRDRRTNQVWLNLPTPPPTDARSTAAIAQLRARAGDWDRTGNQDVFLGRADVRIARDGQLSVRYNDQDFTGRGIDGGPQAAFDATSASDVESRSLVAAYTGSIGQLVNDARLQRMTSDEQHDPIGTAPAVEVRQAGTLVVRTGRASIAPHVGLERTQFADTATFAAAGHILKAGVDLMFDRTDRDPPVPQELVLQSLSSFSSGFLSGPGDMVTITLGMPLTSRINDDAYAGFVEDEWRASPALTIDAGLRYDRQVLTAMPTDGNNWAPRLGVAWAPPSQRLVARGSYGLFYGRTPAALAADEQSLTSSLRTFVASSRGLVQQIQVFDPEFQQPRVQQASVGVEWEWMPHTSIGASYLHARGDDLPRAAATTTSRRVVMLESAGESRYNGVTFELSRRFAQGSYYRAAYTFSKATDTDAAGVWAAADTDSRNRIALSVVYDTDQFAARFSGFAHDVLKDWTLSAIASAQTGQPYSALVSADINEDGNPLDDLAPQTERNSYRRLAFMATDARLARDIDLGGARQLSLLFEVFNLTNRPNYLMVNDVLFGVDTSGALVRNPLFGQPLTQANPRTMRLGVRLSF